MNSTARLTVPLLSLILPCFNEEDVIAVTHRRLTDVLGDKPDFEIEIVYVNDGSSDATEEILFQISETDQRVKVVSFSRNFGHQQALAAGLEQASGDIVAVLDADLQDPPEVIVQMIAEWRRGSDVVYGVRTQRKEAFLKRLSYSVFYRVYRSLANINVQLDAGDFCLMDRRLVQVLNSLPEKNRFIRGLRSWAGFKQTGIVYARDKRAAGTSKYSFFKLTKLALDGIFNFSSVPLTIIFVAGVSIALIAAVAAMVYFTARFGNFSIFGHDPREAPGFTTLILTILFFSGVQLISIGVLGEYLGRVYQEVKMRPAYVIKEIRGGRRK